ncbi:hypothetical protein BJ138DRAFT_1003417 [Hygrophoropsis aurantiaca]|uniref:Uncharacterized protein n=1 Tax=Hygrophoropsis aurantiaca TaxID=72124 RepID=A0ACB8AIC6_9AGAM|nr:hypothetical protein BJ138DRAFT_1003417 [Hygrophoropsis aurantiaca]
MADKCQDHIAYACKCLNIRIRPQPHQGKPPDFLQDSLDKSAYTLTYVGENGLEISHPQVTMRERKLGPQIANTSRCIRFTTLTCLLCQSLVYRVQQIVPPNVEGQEGLLLPTHDWVEQDTLKSSSGWIEVHKDCLGSASISPILSSPSYSSIFAVSIPPESAPSSSDSLFSSAPSISQDIPPRPILPTDQSLFPPAPFTPSHPVFTRLLSIASDKSRSLRTSAEEYLAGIVREKINELEKAEAQLKGEVEGLWKRFLESVSEVEKQRNASSERSASRRRDSSGRLSVSASTSGTGHLISVRDFVPMASSPTRMTSPASIPRISSLSASLATSSFHYPRDVQEQALQSQTANDSPRSPPPYSSHPSSPRSVESRSSSSSASSSEVLSHPKGESILQPFRRSMDQAKDTAASFKYFTNLEADIIRARQPHQNVSRHNVEEDNQTSKASTKAPRDKNEVEVKRSAGEDTALESGKRTRGRHNNSRSKRKVTFNVEPDVLPGDSAVTDQQIGKVAEWTTPKAEEMIFDLEDGSDHEQPESTSHTNLPLLETPHILNRPTRSRLPGSSKLPPSLSSLRPTSLPVYSPLRSIIGDNHVTKSLKASSDLSAVSSTPCPTQSSNHAEPFDPQEEEILKLVAADTPSHRGAWRKNSKAWQVFVSRQGGKGDAPGSSLPEEIEGDNAVRAVGRNDESNIEMSEESWNLPPGIPASLPVDIGPLSHAKVPLSLASYQPKTILSDRMEPSLRSQPSINGRFATSATLRRASYAERDRSRLMDPGALDFAIQDDEDEDEGESDNELSKVDVRDEERGRQRAFKILEARSKIPAAGMWRIYVASDEISDGHVTVTTQGEGIHILKLSTLHPIASHAFGPHTSFSGPAISKHTVEDDTKFSTTYAIVESSPEITKQTKGRILWRMKQNISTGSSSNCEKQSEVLDHPVSRLYYVASSSRLLLISNTGDMSIADDDLRIQSHIQGSQSQTLLDCWMFSRNSCTFLQTHSKAQTEFLLVSCFRSDAVLSVHLTLIDSIGTLVPIGNCELPIHAGQKRDEQSSVTCLSCSSSGTISFIDGSAEWTTYHLDASSGSLTANFAGTPISLSLTSLHGGSASLLSLGQSLVLLAASMKAAPSEVALLLWDLQFGVVVASNTIAIPPPLSHIKVANLHITLTSTDRNQVLLTLSPKKTPDKSKTFRSSVYVIPLASNIKTSLAQAMGKAASTKQWLTNPIGGSKSLGEKDSDDGRASLIRTISSFLSRNKCQLADNAFFKWSNPLSQKPGEDEHAHKRFVYGFDFVKTILNLVLQRKSSGSFTSCSSKIIQHLLQQGEVKANMIEGGLLIALQSCGDWENLMLAFKHVVDISENEMIFVLKSAIALQRDPNHLMDVDGKRAPAPPLATYLFTCVSYPTTVASLRLAVRRHLPDAADLVAVFEVLDSWLFGGTDDDMEAILQTVATNKKVKSPENSLTPPYSKIVEFLQVLLDASFVLLLQYSPSHNLLRRMLEHIEPEVESIDRMEQLRGALEPFQKLQTRLAKEKVEGKETPTEWKKRKRRLEQQAALDIGLYRLEEIFI